MPNGPIVLDGRKPRILSVRTAARSKLFEIEAVHLRFSNGVEAEYERVSSGGQYGAVVVVPVLDNKTILLVREYAVGFDRYELGLPKGLILAGESFSSAAKRELMEEIGYRAERLSHLYTLTIAPGFLSYATEVVLATELSVCAKQGDEPEPVEVIAWPLRKLDALIDARDVTDARSVAALLLAKAALAGTGKGN